MRPKKREFSRFSVSRHTSGTRFACEYKQAAWGHTQHAGAGTPENTCKVSRKHHKEEARQVQTYSHFPARNTCNAETFLLELTCTRRKDLRSNRA